MRKNFLKGDLNGEEKGGEKWNKEKEKREEMEGKEKWLIEEGLWPHCSSFFLTSCSQSVGQIPLLEHRKPHKHVCAHTPFFPYTLKPSITNTHPHKTHTFCQSHTPHTLLIKRTHSAHSHARTHGEQLLFRRGKKEHQGHGHFIGQWKV